jgi:hypothetical protein
MAVNDIYQVTLQIANLGAAKADSLNVFHYRVTDQPGGIDAENISDWVVAEILPEYIALCPDNWLANRVFTQNLMVPEDFNETNPNVAGARAGTAVPPFLAVSIRSPWPGSGYNRASKRLPGGVTADLADTYNWASGFITLIQDATNVTGQVMTLGGGTLLPCTIIPARPNADPPTPVVFRAYVDGQWQYNNRVSTQNSRKIPPLWIEPT